jgi:hypothetical protein
MPHMELKALRHDARATIRTGDGIAALGQHERSGGHERSNLRLDRMGLDPGSRTIAAAARRPGGGL